MISHPIVLRSPKFDEHKIPVPSEISYLATGFNGTLTSAGGDDYLVTKNIIQLIGNNYPKTTLAQDTNFIPLTAENYEDLWRKKSIKAISGTDFSMEDEQRLICEWLNPQNGDKILDLGTSTAMYPRLLIKHNPDTHIVAIDLSMPMLRKAREKSIEDGANIYLVQANAENLPFFAGSFDSVTCGGSLNEFRDPIKALYEARRVLKKGGYLFMMYLMKADSYLGLALQKASSIGGISFWSEEESTQLFSRAGFCIEKDEKHGIVHFVLLKAE